MDSQIDTLDVTDYLSDHLKALARLAEQSGKAEAAALISLAVVSLKDFSEETDSPDAR